MENLIKALTIFLEYGNKQHPTHCEHDVLYVDIDPEDVSEADIDTLGKLGFQPGGDGEYEGGFYSFTFGSC